MSKYLKIEIPKPCHENWDKMNAAAQGRFCNSCQKNVVDFTLMSESDLVNFFKKNTGNVCGRFIESQLNTDIPIPAKKIPWLKYFFQIAIPAFLFSSKATAQTNEIKGKVACYETPRQLLGEISFDTNKTEKPKTVKGKIIDEAGLPVAGASVTVKNTRTGVAADAEGKFTITINSSNTLLVFSSVGLLTQEVDFSRDTSRVITMKPNVMGNVVVVAGLAIRRKTSSFLSFSPVKRNLITVSPTVNPYSFLVFPNPVPPETKLTIKWKEPVAANQEIKIYNSAGELLQQEVIRINKKTIQQSIALKQLHSGAYIITITDSKTRKSSSQQFIVQ